MRRAMAQMMRRKHLWIIVLVIAGLWFFTGTLLMELEWRDLDEDSTTVADIRRDIAEGRTGPILKRYPCMMQETTIDLDMRLDGPFPIGVGRDITMEVFILSNNLMVDRLYLGPPTRHIALKGLPFCAASGRLPESGQEEASYGRLIIHFLDLEGHRFLGFSGEDAFPVFAWRNIRVDWSVMPWYIERTDTETQIMVTPL
jgi:hypothetical protein